MGGQQSPEGLTVFLLRMLFNDYFARTTVWSECTQSPAMCSRGEHLSQPGFLSPSDVRRTL